MIAKNLLTIKQINLYIKTDKIKKPFNKIEYISIIEWFLFEN